MKTINDIRKAIKPIGFNIKTKSLSWGKHATYFHIESKQELSFNVFTPELLEKWKPLFDWRKAHNNELKTVREFTNTIGLI